MRAPTTSQPRRARARLLRFAPLTACLGAVALAACVEGNPAEVREDAPTFPVRASWNASAAPVGSAALRATLAVREYLGSRLEVTLSLTGGAPNTAYQWRIVRGDCATTAQATNATAPTGLWTFATAESYPNVTTDASGAATITRAIAGALDSVTAYSVRVRVAPTTTTWHGTTPLACGNLARSQGG